ADIDSIHPENPGLVPVTPTDFKQFLAGPGTAGQANLVGPLGFGSPPFFPLGQPLPYTIQFQNGAQATSAVGEVRIVSQLDPNLDPRSFRLGDIQLGDI